MKKLGLVGVLVILVVIVVAIVSAGKMGETNHAYAKGKVVLTDDLKTAAKGVHTLFIIALGPDRPMPLGALRTTLSKDASGDVYDFVMTKDNMMMMGMGGGEFPETFRLKARLDVDGGAGPDQPGDLVGEIASVQRGQDGLEIKIDRLIP